MHEIQDAAKIITETVDPNARVIFGAIKDTKLKKDEVKVTVIATGFPDDEHSKEVPQTDAELDDKIDEVLEEEVKPEVKPGKKEKHEIHNNVLPKEPKKITSLDDEEDEDDWNAIPAFLRRGKR